FSLTVAPRNMIVDASAGLIEWTPLVCQRGTNNVSVRVADPQGGFASQQFQVVVSDSAENHHPVITSTPSFVATLNVPYQYQITATDPDADPLTFLLLTAPAGMTVNTNTGLVQWTPALS